MSNENFKIIFTRPEFLYAGMVCQSPDATRYYLNGIHIEDASFCGETGIFIVATDGYRLSFAHDINATIEGNFPKEGIILSIPKSYMNKLKVNHKNNSDTVYNSETRLLNIGSDICYANIVDGTYPDWRRILPSGSISNLNSAYDPSLIADFSKIAKSFGMKKTFIRFGGHDNKYPHWVDIGEPYWRGVIIPSKLEVNGKTIHHDVYEMRIPSYPKNI